MANINAPKGFVPKRHLDGSPYNGQHEVWRIVSVDGIPATQQPPAQNGVPGDEWFDRQHQRFYAPVPITVTVMVTPYAVSICVGSCKI